MPPFGGPAPMMGGSSMGGPMLPKSPFGGPTGPGTSPAMSPGAGAGHEAAAIADIKSVIPILLKSVNALPIGDKRRQALIQAVARLESNFGKDNEDLTPAAGQRIAQAARPGMGLQGHNMPPPGMALGGPTPMGMGGAGGM